MRCHYEVLGLQLDAGDDDIKKSYRKLALRWHPDKNPDNVDEATVEFRSIQTAYDVLSDPQERAWYDKHREAILQGGLGHGDDFKDESLDVYAYFNTSCYSGYDDSEKGFYTVFRQVFEQLATEDRQYTADNSSDKDLSSAEAPGFGNLPSSFEEIVKPFYGYWESYCTVRSYAWKDKYDTRDAPNRFTRRAMEAENKKLREAARRERNEEVRALVAFVKKRDVRVHAEKKRLQERAEEVKRLADGMRKEHKRQHLKKVEGYREAEWASMASLENHLQQLESSLTQEFREPQYASDDDDCDQADDNLFCVVCNKSFKSERSFANHEKSKKHKENLLLLKEEMLSEDAAADEGSGAFTASDDDPEAGDGGDATLPSKQPRPAATAGCSRSQSGSDEMSCDDGEDVDDVEKGLSTQASVAGGRLSKKQRKRRKQQDKQLLLHAAAAAAADDPSAALPLAGSDGDEARGAAETRCLAESSAGPVETRAKAGAAKQKKKRRQQNKQQRTASGAAPTSVPPGTKNGGEAAEPAAPPVDDVDGDQPCADPAAVREVEIAMDSLHVSGDSTINAKVQAGQDWGSSEDWRCSVCKSTFPTRNKLFQHIKAKGHAALKNAEESDDHSPIRGSAGKKKGKRK